MTDDGTSDTPTPEEGICSICGGPYDHYGHNPQPVRDSYDERCCDGCNGTYVIPVRLGARRRIMMPDGKVFIR